MSVPFFENVHKNQMPRDSLDISFFQSDHPLATLTHGDYWNNNMMFKFEGDEPVQMLMLDFQNYVYGLPSKFY